MLSMKSLTGGNVSERRRVHYEHEIEQAAGDALGDQMAEMAWPGVFASGKQIIHMEHVSGWQNSELDVVMFRFADGSEMNIVGKFEVRYKEPPRFNPDLKVHGSTLMTGQGQLQEHPQLELDDKDAEG